MTYRTVLSNEQWAQFEQARQQFTRDIQPTVEEYARLQAQIARDIGPAVEEYTRLVSQFARVTERIGQQYQAAIQHFTDSDAYQQLLDLGTRLASPDLLETVADAIDLPLEGIDEEVTLGEILVIRSAPEVEVQLAAAAAEIAGFIRAQADPRLVTLLLIAVLNAAVTKTGWTGAMSMLFYLAAAGIYDDYRRSAGPLEDRAEDLS